MNWDEYSPKEKAIQLIRVLKSMSFADGHLDGKERSFIQQVGMQQGLSLSTIAVEMSSPVETALLPKTEQERMQVLYYLLFLMKSDGEILEEEKKSIYHFGFKLGFREEQLTNFIDLANTHRNRDIPVQQMLGMIRKFLN